jgi:protein involved in polysaccharide export with SLBB domain
MHLTDVLGSVEELKQGADEHYILIRRENAQDRRVSLVSADLTAALAARGSAADPVLQARDRIFVFDLEPGRERIIKPLLDELRLQSSLSQPTQIVSVQGRVRVPGDYPLEPRMRVADLLRAGGDLRPSAYGGTAELTRYVVDAQGTRQTQLLTVNLAAVRSGDAAANLELQPYDYLLVQETPEWGEQETVVLRGEVRFPGTYPIHKGETLRDVLTRAGGLTMQAFPEGSAFTRSDLKVLEQQQLDRLAANMRSDLVTLSLQAAQAGQGNATESLLSGQSLLSQLQAAKATGRFVIDLPGLMQAGPHSAKDVLLRGGDELMVPKQRQEVTVIGEVQNSSSHLYLTTLARNDYIKLSGGTSRRADNSHIYVVRADGSVATDRAMRPGDTIVVPVDAERMPRLPFWQAVTQILYNVAVSVAAVNSF